MNFLKALRDVQQGRRVYIVDEKGSILDLCIRSGDVIVCKHESDACLLTEAHLMLSNDWRGDAYYPCKNQTFEAILSNMMVLGEYYREVVFFRESKPEMLYNRVYNGAIVWHGTDFSVNIPEEDKKAKDWCIKILEGS